MLMHYMLEWWFILVVNKSSFHSEEIFSSIEFSDLGIGATEIHTCCSASHWHLSKAISSYFGPYSSHIIMCYCCVVIYHNPNMLNARIIFEEPKIFTFAPKCSKTFICSPSICLFCMSAVSNFPNSAPHNFYQYIFLRLLASYSDFFWLLSNKSFFRMIYKCNIYFKIIFVLLKIFGGYLF